MNLEVPLASLLLIGVAILSLLKEIAAVDLIGAVVNLEVPLAGLLLIGVAMLSLLKEIVAVDLTGVVVNLEVPLNFDNLKEETGGFFMPTLAKTSCSDLDTCCNN